MRLTESAAKTVVKWCCSFVLTYNRLHLALRFNWQSSLATRQPGICLQCSMQCTLEEITYTINPPIIIPRILLSPPPVEWVLHKYTHMWLKLIRLNCVENSRHWILITNTTISTSIVAILFTILFTILRRQIQNTLFPIFERLKNFAAPAGDYWRIFGLSAALCTGAVVVFGESSSAQEHVQGESM